MRWVVLVSGAVFVFLAAEILLSFLMKRQLQLESRLGELSRDKKETTVLALRGERDKKFLQFIHISKRMKEEVGLSGIKLKPEEFVTLWFLLIFAPPLLLFAFSPDLILCVALFIAGLMVPPIYLKIASFKQRTLFEAQLGDALMVLSNGLRAGFSFEQALENVAEDLSDPIGGELNLIVRELKLGADMEKAFHTVADRMRSDDLRLMTIAVVIQQRVGGNLADVLDTISKTIRDRLAIKRSIKTLTAQGRISGQIIGALPILLLLALSVMNPGYISPLFVSTPGRLMLCLGGVMEVMGFLVINRIVKIKF